MSDPMIIFLIILGGTTIGTLVVWAYDIVERWWRK